jgi:hypothetical protein
MPGLPFHPRETADNQQLILKKEAHRTMVGRPADVREIPSPAATPSVGIGPGTARQFRSTVARLLVPCRLCACRWECSRPPPRRPAVAWISWPASVQAANRPLFPFSQRTGPAPGRARVRALDPGRKGNCLSSLSNVVYGRRRSRTSTRHFRPAGYPPVLIPLRRCNQCA